MNAWWLSYVDSSRRSDVLRGVDVMVLPEQMIELESDGGLPTGSSSMALDYELKTHVWLAQRRNLLFLDRV